MLELLRRARRLSVRRDELDASLRQTDADLRNVVAALRLAGASDAEIEQAVGPATALAAEVTGLTGLALRS